MSQVPPAVLEHARRSRDAVLAELCEFLSIPSVSKDPSYGEHVLKAAEWLAGRLRALGADRAEILTTDGHPVVYGELASEDPSAATVIMYGHYDVQPAEPLEDWESDPYVGTVRGDNLHARGASDNKGQIMACISAVESVLAAGRPPVNVKFLFEGEEEMGSVHLAECLAANREMFTCDVVLNPDVGMLGESAPTIYYGLRGICMCRLRVTGPSRDLHSGGYGGVVHNPIHALCDLIAGLHGADSRVALHGFYDRVRPMSGQERAEMKVLPLDEAAYLEQSGAPKLWGEREYIPVERAGARPALDVVHVSAGLPKAAIPVSAEALVTVRIVPDQIPEEVRAQLVRYLEERTPPTVRSEILEWEGVPGTLTDRSSPAVRALSSAMITVWGSPPMFNRSGGTIAAVGQIQDILGVDSLLTGFSLPDDRTHGPNEKLHLPTWERGIETLIRFLYNLSDVPHARGATSD